MRRSAVAAACFVFLSVSYRAPADHLCAAGPEWFSGVPALPGYEPRSDCEFQRFAWQTFLALMATDRNRPTARYFTWELPSPALTTLYCGTVCGIPYRAPKNPCGGPPEQEVVNATTQPGLVPAGTSGELVDQAGNPVYFTAHVNPAWLEFVAKSGYQDPAVLGAADPKTSFPSATYEIKTSWRLTDRMSRAEKSQYLTTTACVVPERASDPLAPHTVKEVALVGFHITAGVANHPELVWATFEHARNAPDCARTPEPGPWAFHDGRTDCGDPRTPCNRPNLEPAREPINVCRTYPFGGATDGVARQIASLNRDVRTRLPRGSVLRNYELVGTLWGAYPADGPTLNLQEPGGSPLLSNTSLETFKQGISCFGCHSAQFPAELARFAAPGDPVVYRSKALFTSHIVLFPFFYAARGCAATCPATAASHRASW